jgi:hypothetical protein
MILLHASPTTRVQKRLEEVFAEGQYQKKSATSPLLLHVLIFSQYLDEWRWYMDDLGTTCLRLVKSSMVDGNFTS